MSVRLVTGVLLALAVATSPALACKGSEVIFQDDFKETDASWDVQFGEFNVSGGKLGVKTEPGKIGLMWYEGDFFPGADVCMDIVAPNVKDPGNVTAGLAFTAANSTYFISIRPDGTAGVSRWSGGWLQPVKPRKADAIKTGPGASNTLRMVWKAGNPSVAIYINDKPFVNFKAGEANKNRKIAIYAETEGGDYQISNFKISTPPR